METLALKQATSHPSSHGEDEACEGGWSGYPSDHQTALEKLHVALSDNRDQAEDMLESEASGPVSDRTRTKMRKKKSRVASRSSRRDGDDRRVGPRADADATQNTNDRLDSGGASSYPQICFLRAGAVSNRL